MRPQLRTLLALLLPSLLVLTQCATMRTLPDGTIETIQADKEAIMESLTFVMANWPVVAAQLLDVMDRLDAAQAARDDRKVAAARERAEFLLKIVDQLSRMEASK